MPSTSTTTHGQCAMTFSIRAAMSSAVGATSSNEIAEPAT